MFSCMNGKILPRPFEYDTAGHRPSLKNIQNTYYPRFGFTPKSGIAFPYSRPSLRMDMAAVPVAVTKSVSTGVVFLEYCVTFWSDLSGKVMCNLK